MVLQDKALSKQFFASQYGRSFDPEDRRTPFCVWLTLPFAGPVTNYLALCLFIIEQRGMP